MVIKQTDAYVFCSKAVFLGASVTKSFKKLPDGMISTIFTQLRLQWMA